MRYGPDHGRQRQTLDLCEYLDGLYGYAMALSRNRAEAEDLVQETSLRALRAIDRLQPQSNVKAWLFAILRNVWLNQVRRAHLRLFRLDTEKDGASDPIDTAQDPHAVYASRVEREQVRAALQLLPVDFFEIIVLREYEELSYQEIATVLKCPLGTVMSRLARARSKLRDLLLSDGFTALRVEPDEPGKADQRRHEPGIGLRAESSSHDKHNQPRYWECLSV
jgi:RNA polymerase sigma-70 factor, ECF subfamily